MNPKCIACILVGQAFLEVAVTFDNTSRSRAVITFFGLFRVILSRAEIEFTEEEEDSDSEVSEGTEAARVGFYGLDA